MTTSDDEASTNTLLALGRFVTAFSYLLFALEDSTLRLIAPGPPGSTVPAQIVEQRRLLKVALSDRTASPIVSAFFSVLYERWGEYLRDDDKQILKYLRRELEAVVKERNRLMHDAWVWQVRNNDPSTGVFLRCRMRSHGSGADVEEEAYPPERMIDLAENVKRLAGVVMFMAWSDRLGRDPQVAARYKIIENKVWPKAE